MSSGVKLDPNKSRFKPKESKKTQEDFEKEIAEVQNKEEYLKTQAMQLAGRFLNTIADKTLPENRGVIGQDVERELVNELSSLALFLNNDEHQPEGIGSVGVITVLLNAVLSMRDRINIIAYHTEEHFKKLSGRVDQLEEQIKSLKSSPKEKSSGE